VGSQGYSGFGADDGGAVPEPTTLSLLGLALVGLSISRWNAGRSR